MRPLQSSRFLARNVLPLAAGQHPPPSLAVPSSAPLRPRLLAATSRRSSGQRRGQRQRRHPAAVAARDAAQGRACPDGGWQSHVARVSAVGPRRRAAPPAPCAAGDAAFAGSATAAGGHVWAACSGVAAEDVDAAAQRLDLAPHARQPGPRSAVPLAPAEPDRALCTPARRAADGFPLGPSFPNATAEGRARPGADARPLALDVPAQVRADGAPPKRLVRYPEPDRRRAAAKALARGRARLALAVTGQLAVVEPHRRVGHRLQDRLGTVDAPQGPVQPAARVRRRRPGGGGPDGQAADPAARPVLRRRRRSSQPGDELRQEARPVPRRPAPQEEVVPAGHARARRLAAQGRRDPSRGADVDHGRRSRPRRAQVDTQHEPALVPAATAAAADGQVILRLYQALGVAEQLH